jgi:hypothetical protein
MALASPLLSLLLGRRLTRHRRVVIVSSRTRSLIGDGRPQQPLRWVIALAAATVLSCVLACVAAWRERRARIRERAVDCTSVSTIADARLVLRGRVTDPLTGVGAQQRATATEDGSGGGGAAAHPLHAPPPPPPPPTSHPAPSAPPASDVYPTTPVAAEPPSHSAPSAPRAVDVYSTTAMHPPDNSPPPRFNPAWRGGIVDRVYCHLCGRLWLPGAELVQAPFSRGHVVAWRAEVTHL